MKNKFNDADYIDIQISERYQSYIDWLEYMRNVFENSFVNEPLIKEKQESITKNR